LHNAIAHNQTEVLFVYSPGYEVDIGAHVFPTSKYRLIRESLLRSGEASEQTIVCPIHPAREELERVHTPELLDDMQLLRRSARTIRSELPLTREIADAYLLAAGGTIAACRKALTEDSRTCCHIGGGFHHAFADHAEGFCYINDIAVGIRAMQQEGRVTRAMVIDCDLHQGNGTAHIFQQDPTVFTFSIHQENNYPSKEKSDLDIGLEDGADDATYLSALSAAVPTIIRNHKPELIVYVAGADPYYDDQLGGLRLTMDGLGQRDRLVLQGAAASRIPVVTVTAGGYARQISDTVAIHAQTCRIAAEIAGAAYY
jgi:acetoin utilization deacetylase AcuC-like enzyme